MAAVVVFSEDTVLRDWRLARIWLVRVMKGARWKVRCAMTKRTEIQDVLSELQENLSRGGVMRVSRRAVAYSYQPFLKCNPLRHLHGFRVAIPLTQCLCGELTGMTCVS